MRRRIPLVLAALLALAAPGAAGPGVVILSTTTSLQDSGLLDALVPLFEARTGLTVKTIAVGTGQALALAARGEADVTLAHAPALEREYLAGGRVRNRRPVMSGEFVIVGPREDPAGIRGLPAVDAIARIAARRSRFVSRGDRSGTHLLELALWQRAGLTPGAPWYIESGQGMGATLGIASDRGAYTLADRATWLAFGKRIALTVLVEGDRALANVYSVLEAGPESGPRVNAAGGRAFADFLLGREAQALIGRFGAERYGRPLFVPLGGRPAADGP